jgi:hypothetical protein
MHRNNCRWGEDMSITEIIKIILDNQKSVAPSAWIGRGLAESLAHHIEQLDYDFSLILKNNEKLKARVAELEAQMKLAKFVIQDAQNTIHSEFCSFGEHLPPCNPTREWLAANSKGEK